MTRKSAWMIVMDVTWQCRGTKKVMGRDPDTKTDAYMLQKTAVLISITAVQDQSYSHAPRAISFCHPQRLGWD